MPKQDHGSTRNDIDNNDKMNFRTLEKIYSNRATNFLPQIVDSDGTKVFLETLRNFIYLYTEKDIIPMKRIEMM